MYISMIRRDRVRIFSGLGPLHLILIWTVLKQIFNSGPGTFVNGLVQKTNKHSMYHTTPTEHEHLHFLNKIRLHAPDLIFWNGIGTAGEKVFIICSKAAADKHLPDFQKHQLEFKLTYDIVQFTYVEANPEHPNGVSMMSRINHDVTESTEHIQDPVEQFLMDQKEAEDIEVKLAHGMKMNNQEEAEILIVKRKKRYRSDDGDISEVTRLNSQSPGLLPVVPLKSSDGMREMPIDTGILYRIQSVQTLLQHDEVDADTGEWGGIDRSTGRRTGRVPKVGEYLAASVKNRRIGINPYITAEETREWKNTEYRRHQNKSVLWMFVPTEYEKFYEIRNRNYPFSLLVWNYDLEEGEFILSLETRREYLKRYKQDSALRHRALFSVEMIDQTFKWELIAKRPKFYITTKTSNHIYHYESKKKECTLLVVRNSAETPYMPDKTNKIRRQLDMFYITRIDLSGRHTASIFSFMYQKSIVDIFSSSEEQGNIQQIVDFELANRSPHTQIQYVFEDVPAQNHYTFRFAKSFKEFQWVTIEATIPSFGVSPTVNTGVVGDSTVTNEITRGLTKMHQIKDKVVLNSGYHMNASVIFQHIENFPNPFTALMEVTVPADRLYFDINGKPRFFRLSLPGHLIEHGWNKTDFPYDRVIEKREAALVVQVSGVMYGSYGLRAFAKKSESEYGIGVAACSPSGVN